MFPTHPVEAVTHPDPYPYYAALARGRPLYREPALGLWIACHPDAIRAVMGHPAARVRPPAAPVPPALCPGPAGTLFGRFVRMNDSVPHARLKGLLTDFIREQEPHPQTTAWPDTGALTADAIDRYLAAAPVHAQAAHLGLPPGVYADCAADIGAFLSGLPDVSAGPKTAAAHAAAERLQSRLESHLEAPQTSPALRRLRVAGMRADLAPALLAANLAGLLFQSCEAGAGLLGNALILAGRRGMRGAVSDGQADALVDDVLRKDPPVHNTRRFLAAGIEVCGQRIEAGQTVLLVLAAAAMIEPEAHWTFGALGHACPGAGPARRHAAAALAHLLRAGADAVSLAARFRYRPLPNARVPQFDFSKEPSQ
ncbi:MAG: cytochrome [Achromobacter sp.]|uniref:cytochrome n=1 Tax=Achromobacter sp. TaxID=134375 RepID=UPI003CFD9183